MYATAVRIINHEVNKGYGAALRTGFGAASKVLVFNTYGSGQYDAREIGKLYQPMTGTVEVVNGYMIKRADKRHRILIGSAYNWLARFLFRLPIRDVERLPFVAPELPPPDRIGFIERRHLRRASAEVARGGVRLRGITNQSLPVRPRAVAVSHARPRGPRFSHPVVETRRPAAAPRRRRVSLSLPLAPARREPKSNWRNIRRYPRTYLPISQGSTLRAIHV